MIERNLTILKLITTFEDKESANLCKFLLTLSLFFHDDY